MQLSPSSLLLSVLLITMDLSSAVHDRFYTEPPPLYPYAFPIYGPSDESSSLPEVPTIPSIGTADMFTTLEMFRIFINDTAPTNRTFIDDNVIVDAVAPPVFLTTDSDDGSVTLGLNASLKAFVVKGYESQPAYIPTVPFGITIGREKTWNGSVSLNGNYDANRVNATSWIDLGFKESFLSNGTFEMLANLHSINKTGDVDSNMTVVVDFTSSAIILPKGHNCTSLHVTPLDNDSTFTIVIQDYLIANNTRCRVSGDEKNSNKAILGLPFFQAAYVFAERDGRVYLTQANDYALHVKAEKFDKSATMQPPAAPEGYKSPGTKSLGTHIQATTSNVFLAMLIALLFLF